MSELYKHSATELSQMLRNKDVKPSEIAQSFVDRYKATNDKTNAYAYLDCDATLAKAKELDATPITEATSPLFGLPVSIKDNIATVDMPTTCSSKMLEGYTAPYDATVITKIRNAGALPFGKLRMDEFAMGSGNNEDSVTVKNPHDLTRSPGGSSSGSGAAVASGSALIAFGTDTGGSIRLPANYCGLVGYKPTYGAVSRYGCVGYAGSLDQIGPIARTVADAAMFAEVISGHDPRDAKSKPNYTPNFSGIQTYNLKGKKIGYIKETFSECLTPDMEKTLQGVMDAYKSLGAIVEEVSIPLVAQIPPVYYVTGLTEAASSLARFDGVGFGHRTAQYDTLDDLYTKSRTEGFGNKVKQRLWLGTYFVSAGQYEKYYHKARVARAMLTRQFEDAYKTYDFLLTPMFASTAPLLGEALTDEVDWHADVCATPVNLAGLPSVALPCGTINNMPAGFQLIGKWFKDSELLGAAQAYEKENCNFANKLAEVK